jgi:malate/lactate dehydrogenase
MKNPKPFPLQKTEDEWKSELDTESYRILREKGTEYPLAENTIRILKKVFTNVKAVVRLFTILPISLTVAVAGPVMMQQ